MISIDSPDLRVPKNISVEKWEIFVVKNEGCCKVGEIDLNVPNIGVICSHSGTDLVAILYVIGVSPASTFARVNCAYICIVEM